MKFPIRYTAKMLVLLASQYFSYWAVGQSSLSVEVRDAPGTPVAGAIVTLTNEDSTEIINFGITDNKGKFSVTLPSGKDRFFIAVSAFQYSRQRVEISQSKNVVVVLVADYTELPDVEITPPPVQRRGDTVNYLVSAFADQKDRSIADVLAKMPGIEITGNGQVLYQGKPIQKYYIEGLDLLEGKYNLANQNLPHLSVQSVQVLENHQPIRILDSLLPSDRASLNIKLKSNTTVTGNGKVGGGADPMLWDAAITPMLFKKKMQMIASYQANNVGNDVARQLTTLTTENMKDQLEAAPPPQTTLQLISASPPPISSSRYLDNNVQLLTANHLAKLNKSLELRSSISYLNDAQRRQGNTSTVFYTPNGDVLLNEAIDNRYFANELNAQFTLQQNTGKGYMKNMLTVASVDNSSRGLIINNSDSQFQYLRTPLQQISNQLKWIAPIGKQLVTFFSLVHYDNHPQQLAASPGAFAHIINGGENYTMMNQVFAQKRFYTHHFAELTKAVKSWTIMQRAGILTSLQSLTSDITSAKSPASVLVANDMRNTYTMPYVKTTLAYKKNNFDALIMVPFNAHFFRQQNLMMETETQTQYVTVDPLATANYQLNARWRINAGLSYISSFQNFNQAYTGLVVTNYRSLQTNNLPLAQTRSFSGNTGVYYRDAMRSVFSHLTIHYRRANEPYIIANRIAENGSREMIALSQPNTMQSYAVNGRVSKYFTAIKTTVSASADAGVATANQLLDKNLVMSVNRYVTPGLKLDTRFNKYFAADYQAALTISDNQLANADRNRLQFLSQTMQMHIYPSDRHYIAFSAQHFYNKTTAGTNSALYPDAMYRYSIPKRKIDIQLTLSNLLNERTYITNSFSDFYFYQSEFVIRPRQAIVSVKFQL